MNHNSIPNFLLASAIDIELGNTDDIEKIVGNYLKHSTIPQNYKLLKEIKHRNRFNRIVKDIEKSRKNSDIDGFNKSVMDFNNAKEDYKKDVKEHLASTLTAETIIKKDKKIRELTTENSYLKKKVNTLDSRSTNKNRGKKKNKKKSTKKRKK